MNNASDAHKLASSIAKPHEVEGQKYAVLPKGYTLVDVDKFLGSPTKIDCNIKFMCFESYIDFVKKFKNPTSVSFAKFFSIETIFDYHWYSETNLTTGACKFRATYYGMAFLMADQFTEREGTPPTFKLKGL